MLGSVETEDSIGGGKLADAGQAVLVVEDDEQLGAQVEGHLRAAGFETLWVRDGDEARRVDLAGFDLVILDLMLPGTYGMDLLKSYRERRDIPVLILSARHDTHDKVRALSLGADDYITKPFWPEELIARVQARLRRPQLQRGGKIKAGPFVLEAEQRRFAIGTHEVSLTPAEFALMEVLIMRPDASITRSVLLEKASDPDRQATVRTLDVHISRLRKKLGEEGWRVQTVWGIGYRLNTGAPEE